MLGALIKYRGLLRKISNICMLVVLVIIAFMVFMFTVDKDNYSRVNATVVSIETVNNNKYANIRYSIDDTIYYNTLDTYDDSMTEGKQIVIKYNISNPNDIEYTNINSIIGILIILLIVSIVLRLISIALKDYEIDSNSDIIVKGEIKEIVQCLDTYNEHYVIINAVNPIDNSILEIKSDRTTEYDWNIGDKVYVLIDINNKNHKILWEYNK